MHLYFMHLPGVRFITSFLFSMTSNQVDVQLQPPKRQKFSQVEDYVLRQLVQIHGDHGRWGEIARTLGNGRTLRQCRERYKNYLSPHLRNGPWTPEEEKLLTEKYNEIGPHWSKMTKFFDGRSDVNIKNHYVTMITRETKAELASREINKAESNQSCELACSYFDMEMDNLLEEFRNNSSCEEYELLWF